ncbi:MAG TPA: hypothetical protein ENI99_05015 [Sedimenticola sp.]|nr:hypothetical protein [Sedimenticola sp.]
MRLAGIPLLLLAGVWPLVAGAAASDATPGGGRPTEEALLVDTLNYIRGQRLDDALQSIETLVELNPKFRLAQLVYGDLLLAKSRPIGRFGNLPTGKRARIEELREEARSRLRGHLLQPRSGSLPGSLLRLAPSRKRAIVVDLEMSRLYLFENSDKGLHLLANYYASSGKNGAEKHLEGDRKTPVGVYFISQHIPGDRLPDLYGIGAFPIDYPNPWDRRLGRTGSGIWLHGVPSDTYSRAPRSSNGCVALANSDLEAITPFIEIGKTPVIIANKVEWQAPSAIQQQREDLERAIEKWRRDWESRDMEKYAAHYSRAFNNGKRDYAAWIAQKNRINKGKTKIEVALSQLSIFSDPGEAGLAVVSFQQEYNSNNFSSKADKRQYWRLEDDGVWRIVYEGFD